MVPVAEKEFLKLNRLNRWDLLEPQNIRQVLKEGTLRCFDLDRNEIEPLTVAPHSRFWLLEGILRDLTDSGAVHDLPREVSEKLQHSLSALQQQTGFVPRQNHCFFNVRALRHSTLDYQHVEGYFSTTDTCSLKHAWIAIAGIGVDITRGQLTDDRYRPLTSHHRDQLPENLLVRHSPIFLKDCPQSIDSTRALLNEGYQLNLSWQRDFAER